MRNKIITGLFLSLGTIAFAQVGINTADPKATIDIVAKNARGTSTAPEGLLIPRVDRQKAQSMTGVPTSTLIFVDDVTTGTATGTAIDIHEAGFYHFDGTRWVRLNFDPVLYTPVNLYNTDGTLMGNRTVTQGANRLTFNSTAVNGFSVDGKTFSVNAANNRIGFGTIAPSSKFEIVSDNEGGGPENNFYFKGFGTSKEPALILVSSNGTETAPTNLVNGDQIGSVYFGPRANNSFNASTGSAITSRYRGDGTSLSTDLLFRTSNADRMRIAENGNVGIGTTTPNHRLDLGASVGSSITDVAGKKLAVYNNAAGTDFYGIGVSSGALQFHAASTTTEAPGMVLNSVGNVMIGATTLTQSPSAILELSANNKGFLPPRLTTAQRDALNPKPAGLMVYNVNTNCLEFWNSVSWVSTCAVTAPPAGAITTLNCAGATHNGTIVTGSNTSVTSVIPYTGGNGGSHGGQTVTSTGVTGLTATLAAGNFANGAGNLTYTITGIPSGAGTATFTINIGGQSCSFSRTVTAAPGSVASLNCGSATNSGTLTSGTAASGVSSVIPYTGGNGGAHSGQIVNSTGVTGLTATLVAGSFMNGNGNLTYTITGTPSAFGTANFAINIGGQTCTLSRTVSAPAGTITNLDCASVMRNGDLEVGSAASGVSFEIPYIGGNGGAHSGQAVNSTGVTGLTATLTAGNFANGNGTLTYTITGTPSAAGTANFAINIGGRTCTISVGVLGVCTAEGTYEYPNNPKKYYRCIRFGGQLNRYVYTCPTGSIYNPATKLCVAQ